MNNPYISGNPAKGKAFINRQREVRKVVSRIISGQSVAIISEPRQGKTSLLEYLKSPINQSTLFAALDKKQLLFYYLDIQTVDENLTQERFWSQLFNSQKHHFLVKKSKGELVNAYKICEKDGFTTFNLERLIANLEISGYQLVLLIDEFDVILYHDGLNKAEFYGGLRSLSTRYGQALTLVLASRLSVSKLNLSTQEYSRTGSPFFNFMSEVKLEPFSQKAIDELFDITEKKFSKNEKDYIQSLAGGHPYLLQAAASTLWNTYSESLKPQERLEQVGKELFRVTEDTLSGTWSLWSPEIRKAFVVVALDEVPRLLNAQDLDFNELRKILKEYVPELRYLEERGFIVKDSQLPTGWAVGSKIMLWWLADMLIIALREKNDIGQFVRLQQWDGLLSEKEKAQLAKSIGYIATVAKSGVESFVKAAAEGFGKGISPK